MTKNRSSEIFAANVFRKKVILVAKNFSLPPNSAPGFRHCLWVYNFFLSRYMYMVTDYKIHRNGFAQAQQCYSWSNEAWVNWW